jgi:hypothetical protein
LGIILNDIEQEVNALPKTNPRKHSYSNLVTDFKIFKDAWHNHVAQIGSKYVEDNADSIYRHVGRFMKGLAGSGFKE